ncbi:MAG: deoxyribodipyrimidine photo-lyase [Anaerolineae bacterium]
MTTAIWWLRRDLRLTDNQALHAALQHADSILPVFVLDDALWESPYVGGKRLAFMLGGLRAVDTDLRDRGSRLIVRRGRPADVLAQLADDAGAQTIFAEADFSPYARSRDRAVAERGALTHTDGLAVRPPGTVLKNDGDPYSVYSWFRKTWLDRALPTRSDVLPAPDAIATPDSLPSEAIPAAPALPDSVPFEPGEAAAEKRLKAFIDGPIYAYDKKRDRTDLDGTSRISP